MIIGGFKMSQLNIHMTPAFEKDLLKFMKVRHLPTKAEAVRLAIREALEHAIKHKKPIDFSAWINLGNQASTNKNVKFNSDDDLWK